MHARTLAALLIVAIAGCAAPGAEPDTPEPAVADLLAFDEPIVAGAYPNSQAEAFIEASPDGQTLLTCAHGEFRESSPMYASTDGGTTWRQLAAPADSPFGGDCEVALNGDTWVFLASTVASATTLVTQDQGATWSVNPVAAVPTNGLADRPWISFDGDRLLLSYMPLWFQPGLIGTMFSDDLGQTWSVPSYASQVAPGQTSAVQGQFLVDPSDGSVRIPLVKTMGTEINQVGSITLALSTSADHGATWTERTVKGPFQAYFAGSTAVAQGGDGTLYWTYYADVAGKVATFVMVSADRGASWGEPVSVNLGSLPASIAWGDGRPDGSMDLVWAGNDTQADGKPQVTVLRLDHRVPGLVVDRFDFAPLEATAPEFVTLEHDAAGNAYVVLPEMEGLLVTGQGTVTLHRESR